MPSRQHLSAASARAQPIFISVSRRHRPPPRLLARRPIRPFRRSFPRTPRRASASMERAGGEAGAPAPPPAPAAAAAGAGVGAAKGRSCKGCLFYSSVLRSRARGPICVGVTRALPQVSERMIGEIELEAIKEGRNLSDFKYACVGYSVYLDDKETSAGVREKKAHAQLPACVGVELLADRRPPAKKAPTHNDKGAPQPHQYKPRHAGDDFVTKFQRNAGLVANGVAKNLNKVGTFIKDTVGDMMYPDRKRPK